MWMMVATLCVALDSSGVRVECQTYSKLVVSLPECRKMEKAVDEYIAWQSDGNTGRIIHRATACQMGRDA